MKRPDLRNNFFRLFFAAKPSRPIAYAANWVEGEFVWAHVFSSYNQPVDHSRTSDEFFARGRMREIALFEATNTTSASNVELAV